MNILVIGGSGFIGQHLVSGLARHGHHVSVLDLLQREDAPVVRQFVGSHEDRELLERVVHGQDLVVQLVSTTVPASSNQDVEFDIRSNLISLIRLLEVMRSQNVMRIVYLSSGGAVYGAPDSYPVAESHTLKPVSSYGIVKVAAEHYIRTYAELYGFQPLVFRPSNAYGPGQNLVKPQGVIGHFLRQALQGDSLQVWGDGTIRRDYLYIDDLVELMVGAIGKGSSGVFNAGSGTDFSLNQIIEVLEQVIGSKLTCDYLPARNAEVERIRLDISKAQDEVGWQPQVSLEDGIQRQYEAAMKELGKGRAANG